MKKIAPLFLIAALLFTLVPMDTENISAQTIGELEKQIQELEKQQSELNKNKSELESNKGETDSKLSQNESEQKSVQSEIDSLDNQLKETENNIASKENEISLTNKEIELLAAKIKELTDRIEELKKEIEVLEERIAKRDVLLKDRLRSIQQNGGDMQYMEVIFGASSFGDFISRTSAVNTIMDQDKTIMEAQAADKLALEDNKTEVEESKAEVETQKVAVEDKKKSLENQKSELLALEKQLDSQKSERQTLMAQLEEEHDHLEDHKISIEEEQKLIAAEANVKQKAIEQAQSKKGELEQLAKEEQKKASAAKSGNATATNAPSQPASSGSGKLLKPVNAAVNSHFGYRYHPITNINKLHAGIDMAVPTGTPLAAPADGIVSTAGWVNGYGKTIMVTHYIDGEVITTLMAHLNSISVSVGQSVSRGQIIGQTGNTGDSTGPHLHFEVHKGGYKNPVNPLPYL